MLRWGSGVGLLLAAVAGAQTPRVEAGVQLSVIDVNVLGEKPPLAGGRISVRVVEPISLEAEVNRFPIAGAFSNYPATQVLTGARVGYRFGRFGLFGKLRPGFINFDRNLYALGFDRQAALDMGGILEVYSQWHIAVRIDFGDTVVWYGDSLVQRPSGGPPIAFGTRHQFQGGFGISVWF